MRLQPAFTFTELLIVVAALAMLAAAAVPRFFAVNKEIRTGAVQALAANVESSANLTNRIWASSGHSPRLTVDGQEVDMRYGYPTERSISDVVVSNGDFLFADGYWKHKHSSSASGCAVLYVQPSNPASEPVVISYTEGC